MAPGRTRFHKSTQGIYPVARNNLLGSRSGQAWYGGQARVRTLEAIRQQIYSLPPLSTWVPARPTFILDNNGIQLCRQIENTSGPILIVENKRFRHAQHPSRYRRLAC